MRSEPRWLEPDEVVELNRLIVEATGEPFQLLDAGLLGSALDRARQHWSYGEDDDVANLATTLLFGLARNHPFQQGNKRTAFEAALMFLEWNGYALEAEDSTSLSDLIIQVITHAATEDEFTSAIRPYVMALPGND